ncbi:MAG: hypothetical protein WKF87_00215 [Chryseolinea sp.]
MRTILVAMLFLPFVAFCNGPNPLVLQGSQKLYYYLNAYTQADGSAPNSEALTRFIKTLEKKKASVGSQRQFISYLFNKTHRKFLRSYSSEVTFGQLVHGGTYNCLTGTALYALLLDHFEIEYQVIETNHHIFILAQSGDTQALIEATDPENGFVEGAEKIRARIEGYRKIELQKSDAAKTYFEYTTEVYREVSLDEMLGLMHYNLSVASYNKQDLVSAINHLVSATKLYRSSRIDEYSRIVLLTILESDLAPAVKQQCLEKTTEAVGAKLQAALPPAQAQTSVKY